MQSYNTAMQPFVKKKLPAEKTFTIRSEPPFSFVMPYTIASLPPVKSP
jgi:hypothetical protein